MDDNDIKNPFSDPEFRDMLLKKEGIKDNTGFDVLIPEDVNPENEMMKGIIRKLGLTNYVYQFTMFNGEEE